MTEVDWENLDKLDAERTPGSVYFDGGTSYALPSGDYVDPSLICESTGETLFSEMYPADAKFVRALWNAFPAIKAERDAQAATIRALQEKNEGLSNFRDQIIKHYENQDMSHLDFRVHAYKHALTLKDTPNAD